MRLSPAPGAGPSVRSPSAAVAGPSSSAMSPSRITCPVAVASAGTVMRPVPATAAALTSNKATNAESRRARRTTPPHGGKGHRRGDLRSSRARPQLREDASFTSRTWSEDREPRRCPFPPPRRASVDAPLANDGIGRPQHLVRGLDRLGGHLVGALPGDERDQLLDHAHVGVLEEALEQRAAVLLPRRAHLRRAGGLGLLEE